MPDELKDVMVDRALKKMPKAKESRPKQYDEIEEHYRKGSKEGFIGRLRDATDNLNKIVAGVPTRDEFGTPPLPPAPARFQKDVPVVGGPIIAQEARKMLDIDPLTKTMVSKIAVAPTQGSVAEMIKSKLPPGSFGRTNLLGVYSPFGSKEIGLQPGREGWRRTLIHELGHAAGWEEEGAEAGEALYADPASSPDANTNALIDALIKRLHDRGLLPNGIPAKKP